MYKLLYSGETKDLNEVSLKVEIYKESVDDITTKEITLGGDEPIVIEYDSGGDIFKPLIQSTCTIKVVTDEPLLNLYTGKLNEICVKVFKGESLFWYGFLTPNVYTQEYEAGPNSFDLEFIDLIAHLENIKFKKVGFFKTFYQYLNNAVDKVDTMGVIKGYVNQEDVDINLKTMGVLERNFIDETGDEEDGSMTYKEMFESIVTWMSKSMIQWGDKIYIVDLSKLKNCVCGLYDRATAEKTYYSLDTAEKRLNYLNGSGNVVGDIFVNDASCSISLGDVYNKVTVIANTNEIENVIPDIFDEDKKVSIMDEGVDYTTTTVVSNRNINDNQTVANKTFTQLNAFFVQKDWGLPYGISNPSSPESTYTGFDIIDYDDNGNVKTLRYHYGTKTSVLSDGVNEPVMGQNFNWWVGDVDTGVAIEWYNFSCYSKCKVDDDGYWIVNVPIDYVSGNELGGTTVNVGSNILLGIGNYGDPDIVWKMLSGGEGKKINNDNVTKVEAMTCIQKYADWCHADGEPSTLDWKTVLTMGRTTWELDMNQIWTGNFQYKGNNEPDTYITLMNKPSFIGLGGYFILSMSYLFSNVHLFGNVSPYNFTSETYGTCLPYARIDTDCSYRDDKFKVILKVGDYAYNGSEWVKVTNSLATPSFYITHKNNPGDKIFGTTKSIDNTVSYSWNLASSKDGYAIPLPNDKVLSGPLTFTLYADSRLGGNAQYNNHGWIIAHHGDADAYHQFDGYVQNVSPILAIHIDKLELIYTTKDTVSDVYNLEEYEPDIKYTNVVNDAYVTELDDIEMKVNSYTPHAVSYSYVLKHNTDDSYEYVTEIDGLKQEERHLQKYVYFYKNPKLKYTNNLNADLITPFRPIYIKSLDKEMIPIGLSYDLANNRVNTQLIEF